MITIASELNLKHDKKFNVTLVREDGTTLIVDLVPARDEHHAAHTTVWFFTPTRWADGQAVKAYINGEEIL